MAPLSAAPHGAGLRAIATYVAACALIGLVAAAFLPDYTGKDISAEYTTKVPSPRQRPRARCF
jgi:hypothetical protein